MVCSIACSDVATGGGRLCWWYTARWTMQASHQRKYCSLEKRNSAAVGDSVAVILWLSCTLKAVWYAEGLAD